VGELRVRCGVHVGRRRVPKDEHVIPLEEAIRRLTSLPAHNLRIKDRGRLAAGQFADVVVFDPKAIADRATYEQPHQYAVGVRDVWVNGTQVLKDGEHTGAKPGRVVRGGTAKELPVTVGERPNS
jgi:N-acyl-D-amino-acid deacylase